MATLLTFSHQKTNFQRRKKKEQRTHTHKQTIEDGWGGQSGMIQMN